MAEKTIENTKPKRLRSSAYPAIGLENAVKLTERLHGNLGRGPYGRDAMAKAIGYGSLSGLAGQKIAALTHFGLLSRKANAYQQSTLADRILRPVSDKDKHSAILESAQTPKLYSNLITKFRNLALPTLLHNIISREFNISDKVSQKATEDFKNSLEFAGLLKNGVVIEPAEVSEPVSKEQEQPKNELNASSEDQIQEKSVSIELGLGARIFFPNSLSFHVATGAFSEELKKIKEKLKKLVKENNMEG